MALTISQITKALKLSRSRVDQWISRGHFKTPDKPLIGKPRDWDMSDAIRLQLMNLLLQHKLKDEIAGYLVGEWVHGFKNDDAYFVAWSGPAETALTDGKLYIPGHFQREIVRKAELTAFVTNSDVYLSIVINLDRLEREVKAKLSPLINAEINKDGSEVE